MKSLRLQHSLSVLRLSLFPALAGKSGVLGVVIVVFLFCKAEMSLLTPKYRHEGGFKRRILGEGSVLPNGVGNEGQHGAHTGMSPLTFHLIGRTSSASPNLVLPIHFLSWRVASHTFICVQCSSQSLPQATRTAQQGLVLPAKCDN